MGSENRLAGNAWVRAPLARHTFSEAVQKRKGSGIVMNEEFKALGGKAWAVTDDALIYNGNKVLFSELSSLNLVTTPTTPLTNGVAQAVHQGKVYTLAFKYADKARAHSAIDFAKDKISEAHGAVKNYKYKLLSHTGSYLEVYDDYVILYFMPVGSLLGNIARGGTTGGKKITYRDMTSIQFREPSGTAVGFIQFSYPGSIENKGGVIAAVNDENSIVFQPDQLPLAREIVYFIENAGRSQGYLPRRQSSSRPPPPMN